MKRIIALVCTLMLLLAALPAAAEDAMPQEVRTFFEALGDAVDIDQVACASDLLTYAEGMPGALLSFSGSRSQYNSFYYYVADNTVAVTVCCLDGKPLAYILDCSPIDFIGYKEAMHNILQVLPDAYCKANPQQESSMDGYGFFTNEMLQSIYDPAAEVLVSDMQDHGQTLVSSHLFTSGSQMMCVQLFPKAAYEGLIVQETELTPEANHSLSGLLAVDTEYQLIMRSLE